MSQRRPLLVSAGLALSMALLVPGLVLPVLSVRGELQPAGLAPLVPSIVEAGLTPEALATIRPLMNPVALAVIELSPGGLQGALADRLSPQIIAGLSRSEPIDVYAQTRSILGAVRHLYAVGSPTAATLILLFSVIVPVAKIGLVLAAMAAHDEGRRQRTLGFVEVIAKWSMADVFAVAIIIAYLATQASTSLPGVDAPASAVFSATFGPGFYWFAGYCLTSLAVQQATARRWLAPAGGRQVAGRA
jgi:hypothetical protein